MRGKHRNAAKNRRDRAELEQRAETAERRAERLEKELTETREANQRHVLGLQTELKAALKDREAAASPRLSEAEETIRALMAERDEAVKKCRRTEDRWQAFTKNATEVLKGMGLTGIEAAETLLAIATPDGSARTIYTGTRPRSAEQAVLVQRARGERGTSDRLAARKPHEADRE